LFIRFVNGLVDPEQKSVFAGSISNIAEAIGLPSVFVEIRHAGTHDLLPSIDILRNGAAQVIKFIQDCRDMHILKFFFYSYLILLNDVFILTGIEMAL